MIHFELNFIFGMPTIFKNINLKNISLKTIEFIPYSAKEECYYNVGSFLNQNHFLVNSFKICKYVFLLC